MGAMLAWTLGDFFIQKTVRAVGTIQALFYIGAFGAVVLLPWTYKDLHLLATSEVLTLLCWVFVITLVSAVLDLQALKIGKFSVVESLYGIELPVTVILSLGIRKEYLTPMQISLILLVFLGMLMVSNRGIRLLKIRTEYLEKGVLLAILGAFGMGITNFVYGVAAQDISPVLTLWFTHFALVIATVIFILVRGNIVELYTNIKKYPKIIFVQSVLDNLAWLFFAFSVSLIPIAIATTLSQSYIGLAAILGLWLNKEKLKKHQMAGVGIIFFATGLLAWLTSGLS